MYNMYNTSTEELHMPSTCNKSLVLVPRNGGPCFPLPIFILLAVLMVLLVFITVLGNALVILAFVVDKNLRHRSNYFFLNLAVSDFAVGAFCIPMYIPYALTGKWEFGKGPCKLWLLLDHLMCTASSFNIALISYDRYLSVTKAVFYRILQRMTSKTVIMMGAIWVFAFLLYGPAIIIWEYVAGCSIVPDDECYPEFSYNWYFSLCASVFEFFTPLISIAYFNFHIFQSIRKRLRSPTHQLSENSKSKSQSWGSSSSGNNFSTSVGYMYSVTLDSSVASQVHSKTAKEAHFRGFRKRTWSKMQRDKKAAKSLAIIVYIFAICWAPYSLLTIISAACRKQCISEPLFEFTSWLLWFNSSVNPFLYPLCHVKFRRAFRKIFCLKKPVIFESHQPDSSKDPSVDTP